MLGYDGWKLASPYDDDAEWEETGLVLGVVPTMKGR